MKTAIISDIHGNYQALQAVFVDIAKHGVDRIVCLGDVVGYGAQPGKCLDAVKEACDFIVMGNHDSVVVDPSSLDWFNDRVAAALRWTIDELTGKQKKFIADFPKCVLDTELFGEDCRLSFWHAAPYSGWGYANMRPLHSDIIEDRRGRNIISLMGHTHTVQFWPHNEGNTPPLPIQHCVVQEAGKIMMYNVGSVGQPRDRDYRAAYAIADHKQGTIKNFRVEYDVDTAAQLILDAGLPEFLATRLFEGR